MINVSLMKNNNLRCLRFELVNLKKKLRIQCVEEFEEEQKKKCED